MPSSSASIARTFFSRSSNKIAALQRLAAKQSRENPQLNLQWSFVDMIGATLGRGEASLAESIVQQFTTTSSGALEPMTEGLTKLVTSTVAHAGITKVERYKVFALISEIALRKRRALSAESSSKFIVR